MLRINLEGIYKISDDLNEKVAHSFITNITVVNYSDLLLAFSFYNKEKLLISLNHQNPFLGFVDKNYSPHTVLGGLNDNLRKYIKGAYIESVEVLNDDRVLKFNLYKSDEFYQKQKYSMILELIPTISNLILLNGNNEILFAKHYADLSASRPVIRGMNYQSIIRNQNLLRGDFNYDKYKEEIKNYVVESDHKKQKEQVLPLYNFLKQKEKSLRKKAKVLETELDAAKNNLIFKEYGENVLMYSYSPEELADYSKTLGDKYDSTMSPEKNAEVFFNKYKKAKRTIENVEREIAKANKDSLEIGYYLSTFDYLASEEIAVLEDKYLPHKSTNKKKVIIDASKPYYINIKDIRIGFGKNKEQNNYLTFKKANKEDTFIHVADQHASHVVIFDNNPDNEALLVGCEIALLLSGKEDGEIQVAKIKDIKKGPEKGLVLLNKYQTINLKSVRNSTKLLLKNQKRFN